MYCIIDWRISKVNCFSVFMQFLWDFPNLSSSQTYVLDVHPFNPRIAMSAGYDGRTIVWDVNFLFLWLLFSKFSCILWFEGGFWLFLLVILDMGRKTDQDLWDFTLQTGWWKVFTVCSLSSFIYLFIMYYLSRPVSSLVNVTSTVTFITIYLARCCLWLLLSYLYFFILHLW